MNPEPSQLIIHARNAVDESSYWIFSRNGVQRHTTTTASITTASTHRVYQRCFARVGAPSRSLVAVPRDAARCVPDAVRPDALRCCALGASVWLSPGIRSHGIRSIEHWSHVVGSGRGRAGLVSRQARSAAACVRLCCDTTGCACRLALFFLPSFGIAPHSPSMPPSNRAGSHLLIAGGTIADPTNEHQSAGCAAFDPKSSCWRPIPSINTPREYGCAATIRDTAFNYGGHDGSIYSPEFESLSVAAMEQSLATADPAPVFEQKWRTINSQPTTTRAGARLVALEQRLFLVGGFNGKFLSSMEVRRTLWRTTRCLSRFAQFLSAGVRRGRCSLDVRNENGGKEKRSRVGRAYAAYLSCWGWH